MIRTPVAVALATLAAACAGVTVAAPTASADTLNCLANVTAVQNLNNTAMADDRAGNTSAAAAEDSGVAYYQSQVGPNCYYNPSVTYSAYQDTISGYSYVGAAWSANNAGDSATALRYGQAAATYLGAAVTLLSRTGPP
jgi:hypothetical protein